MQFCVLHILRRYKWCVRSLKHSCGNINKDEDDEDKEKPLKPSPDANTFLHFTKPLNSGMCFLYKLMQYFMQWDNRVLVSAFLTSCTVAVDFVAGFPVRVLLGFTNKASKDFVLDTMDASFRYPQDYSYFIHNVS